MARESGWRLRPGCARPPLKESCGAPIRSSGETAVTCPACGQDERQDRKGARAQRPPGGRLTLTLHHECPAGHAWHRPLVIPPGVRPAPCDCEGEA